jgi:serine/threonine-protein kinase
MPTAFVPGTVVGGRFEIRRTIGADDASTVYEATDTSLRRSVAIRVLQPGVLPNDEWREFFKHQTNAVAALHHPGLTRIYEWGELEGQGYVVTEYLAGGSLRDILAQGRVLTFEQVTMIGAEVAAALAFAHARGFVHAALRPSKVLFDEEGRARVADLGLAAALGASPTAGRSLDEARYTSPEQVLGQPAEPKSDVYSLSLILFQCLTGHNAHDGRSIEQIRTNRLGAPLPQRPELGPLDLLIAMGAAPEAAARPDAALFSNRLLALAATLPVPRPVTISAFNTMGFTAPTIDDVMTLPAMATGRTDAYTEVVRPMDLPGYREQFEASRATPAVRTRRRAPALLAVILLLAAALGVGIAWKLSLFTPTTNVPTLTGLTTREALAALSSHGGNLTLANKGTAHSATVPAGEIVRQSPSAGTSLKQGSQISVWFSSGPTSIALPDVIGKGCATATGVLATAGLTASCPTGIEVNSPTVKLGGVVAVIWNKVSNPTTVPEGATVELSISKGPVSTTPTTTTTVVNKGPRPVPNLVGDDPAETTTAMQAAQLYYVTSGPGSQNGTWTKVVSTSPVAGTEVAWHATVYVTVTN